LILTTSSTWFRWAFPSAVFAALTAIFAKIGIQVVGSDLVFHHGKPSSGRALRRIFVRLCIGGPGW